MTTLPSDPVTKTIVPAPRWPGLGLGELWRMRHVLIVLAQRQHKIRYSNLALGIVWVILEPLLLTIIVAFLLGLLLGRGDRMGIPFPVFLFTAWVAFRPFSRLVSLGGASIRGNAALIDRIYLPRAYFPISVAMVSLIDLAAMAVALLVLLAIYGIVPGVGMLMLPVLVVILYAFGLGAAFFFSAASMSLPDVDIVKMLIVRSWFWLSPVIYPSSMIPAGLRNIYYLNPMAVVIDGFRWSFAQAPMPPPQEWIIGSCSAAAILVFGYVFFRRREAYFADEL